MIAVVNEEEFMVIRGDDNGQNFIVRDGLKFDDAWTLYYRLMQGHKQWYMVLPYTAVTKLDLIKHHDLRI